MGMKKHNPGCSSSGGCCGPCCATVWNPIRTAHGGIRTSLINTSESPNPSRDDTFWEYSDTLGFRVYQCSVGNLSGVWEAVPPAASSIPVTSGLNRVAVATGINSTTGACSYVQSQGGSSLAVQLCDPATVRLEVRLSYGIDAAPDWVYDLGFTCVGSEPCIEWSRVDGYTTTVVYKNWSGAFGCPAVPYLISARYTRDITTIPSGIPLTLDVVPYYNPANLITRVEWI